MPMPRARPPSDMMFRVTLDRCMGAKVATTEIGMAVPMMSVEVRLRRKKKSTRMARIPPIIAVLRTSRMEASTKVD